MTAKYRYFLIKCNNVGYLDLNLGNNCIIIKTDANGYNMKHFHPKYGKFKSLVKEFYCFFQEVSGDIDYIWQEIKRKDVTKYLLTYKLTK